MGLRPCSTAAEPALSMCCCSLSFCTSRHNPGQQKMKVEGSAECWAGGEASPVSYHSSNLFEQTQENLPKGESAPGHQLQTIAAALPAAWISFGWG